jgi:hypothetical protein
MTVSRRVFLGAAAGASALAHTGRRCSVLDFGCLLPESLKGFRAQVGNARHDDSDIVIVPGAGSLTPATVQPFLDRGATVLLELFTCGAPVKPEPYFPYVEYSWPIKVKIREFGAVALEPAPGDQVIGTFVRHPVALRRRAGRGTLVVLGSLLGPVFLSGDQDARRWLDAFLL